MTFKNHPYIEVGSFYKLHVDDARAVAFCKDESTFTILKGSTAKFHRPSVDNSCLEEEYVPTEVVTYELEIEVMCSDAMAHKVQGRFDIVADFSGFNPLQAAQFLVGVDNVNPQELWKPVF
ncbi:MAG: hypothetical protein MJ138_05750 [Kiritimatiellae bacterium]|nr:hypothetical protein [Kiritimatiellia bacterium]